MKLLALNPVALKRWRRFRSLRRGWYSLWLLLGLFAVSLVAELVCNSRPLLLRHEGRWYFPLFRYYPEDVFLHNGVQTRTDYRRLLADPAFHGRALRTPLKSDPYAVVSQEELAGELRVQARLRPLPRVGVVRVSKSGDILAETGMASVLPPGPPLVGRNLSEIVKLDGPLADELALRFSSPASRERFAHDCEPSAGGGPGLRATLAHRPEGAEPPESLRIIFRIPDDLAGTPQAWWFDIGAQEPRRHRRAFLGLPADVRSAMLKRLERAANGESVEDLTLDFAGRHWRLSVEREKLRFPFRPVKGHWLGLDDAGRDVFARILYGLRSSLSFGLILVVLSLGLGSLAGMLQGYVGGWCDILGQRLIEIWSSLPFLYVIILMGSIYGPSFSLLLFCYALFNWIGISYYMRAEVLRLRKQPFVEAARCLGLPGWKIALRHILPNAMVPLITFFPFSLVGAIGALASLDYLGFGLPPPTPSLGQLLQQAQVQRWAWWLIAYPSLTLFIVMLLGIFIGEGIREAFDPRRQSRLQ